VIGRLVEDEEVWIVGAEDGKGHAGLLTSRQTDDLKEKNIGKVLLFGKSSVKITTIRLRITC